MSQQELLIFVARALEAASIPYLLTGSVASSLQGEPRASHDLDLVVALSGTDVASLAAAFPGEEFYLDDLSAREAIERRDMFNVIYVPEATKIDFWLLTDHPFDRSRFSRRVRAAIDSQSLWVSAPEDTILAKLRWARMCGGSEKQLQDAVRVYEVQFPGLDQRYLEHWAAALGVADYLAEVRQRAVVA